MLIVLIIFLFSVLIIVHELGHFFAARLAKVRVEEFGFGFPPRLLAVFKKSKKGLRFAWGRAGKLPKAKTTIYSINAIPFGGFVRLKGEDTADEKGPDSFAQKPLITRTLIVAAGVVMNFLLAIIVFGALSFYGLPQALVGDDPAGGQIRDRAVYITQVVAESPAQKSGLRPGDKIIKIKLGDKELRPASEVEVKDIVISSAGEELIFEINRANKTQAITVRPDKNEETQEPVVGIGMIAAGIVSYPWYQAPLKGLEASVNISSAIVVGVASMLKELIVQGSVPEGVAGPVGIFNISYQAAQMGLVHLLALIAVVSLNLAILNLLPFPALDGGRLFFYLIEAVRGRAVSPKAERVAHTAGFVILMILIVLITIRDVNRLF